MKTDLGVYTEPPLPTLPLAGGKFLDPVFNSEIIRITDSVTDPGGAGVAYSYWPTFNCNSTRLIIHSGSTPTFIEFDPATKTIKGRTKATNDPGLVWHNGAYWDQTNPDVIYSTPYGLQVYSYNVRTNVFTVAGNLSGVLGADRYLVQPSMSADRKVIAATIGKKPEWAKIGFIAYDLANNRVLIKNEAQSGTNEVYISTGGRHVSVMLDSPQRADFYDTQNNNSKQTIDYATQDGWSHSTVMRDHMVGMTSASTTAIIKRAFTDQLNTRQNILEFRKADGSWDWGRGGSHISALKADESEVLISTFGGAPEWAVFKNEIFTVSTDGLKKVKRICHHRSKYSVYEDSPRANISPDGRFCAFTSNWGGSGRRDVFVAYIGESTITPTTVEPPLPPTSPPPPPPPIEPTPTTPTTPTAPAAGSLKKDVAWSISETADNLEARKQRALGYYFHAHQAGKKATFVYTGVKLTN